MKLLHVCTLFLLGRLKKVKRKPLKSKKEVKSKPIDIYNTVWLSDYESIKSIKSVGSKSLNTSSSSFIESTNMSHSTPRKFDTNSNQHHVNRSLNLAQPKHAKWLTLSLPELDMATLSGNDLSERFARLQLEQDNRDLQSMVETLQKTLDKVKTSVFPYEAECCYECVDSKNALDGIFYELSHKMHQRKSTTKDWSVSYIERTESGYDTLQHDSSLPHMDVISSLSNHTLLMTPEEEDRYFESRLVKPQGVSSSGNDSHCCIVN